MATTGETKMIDFKNTTPTHDELDNPLFWIGKENGIKDSHGLSVTPYYSVFVDGELIKHNKVMKEYPYSIALELAKPYPNASIEVMAYHRSLV